MSKINRITPLTHVNYLNLYEIEAENKMGKSHSYYVASRKSQENMMATTGICTSDGVCIYSLYGEHNDRLVMVRQYRYPINDFIYELPAGLIDSGETASEAAVREMKEETGLDFRPISCKSYLNRPHFSSVGMTDEANATIYGCSTGNPSLRFLEPNEELSVVLVDRDEAIRILKEENLSVKAYYLLLHFLHSDSSNPFDFLDL